MAGKAMESLLILKMSYPTVKQDIKASTKSAHLKNITFTIQKDMIWLGQGHKNQETKKMIVYTGFTDSVLVFTIKVKKHGQLHGTAQLSKTWKHKKDTPEWKKVNLTDLYLTQYFRYTYNKICFTIIYSGCMLKFL